LTSITRTATATATIFAAVATLACKKSGAPPPEITGLAAVPSTAQVVIAADVARVIDSPLVERAIEQLLVRDATLAARWQKLKDACKLDVGTQVKRLVLAIGPHAGPQPGTGPVLVVATGKLVESELAACVRAMVGQGGGSLTATTAGGRTVYQAQDAGRTMYFAFGRSDTVVLGSDAAFVTEAIDAGKKVLDDPDMKRWIGLADQNAPVWAAGRVDERVRTGLVRVTDKQLGQGPQAFVVAFDPTTGAEVELGAVMATTGDAKTLESFAKNQLALLGMAAQVKGLMKVVDRVKITAEGDVVRFRAALDVDDVNQLVSALDGGGAAKQDSPPAGSGAGSAK
jgi:hypothetical protein